MNVPASNTLFFCKGYDLSNMTDSDRVIAVGSVVFLRYLNSESRPSWADFVITELGVGLSGEYYTANVKLYNPYEDKKDTNPKDAIGVTKAPMSVVPSTALIALGQAMLEGSQKYGRHNYRTAGIRFSVYYDAAMRHLMAWWEGEDIDPDSGLAHPVKAMACMAIVVDAMAQDNATDDRPPKSRKGWMNDANEHTKRLLEKYPDPKEPHTEV